MIKTVVYANMALSVNCMVYHGSNRINFITVIAGHISCN